MPGAFEIHRTFRHTYLTIVDPNEVQGQNIRVVIVCSCQTCTCSTFFSVPLTAIDLDSDFAKSDLQGTNPILLFHSSVC